MLYRLDKVVKQYSGTTAFETDNLELAAGKLIAIVGNSGSGKSTFLKLIGGITSPTSGDVYFEGLKLNGAKPKAIENYYQRSIDIIFQEFNLLANLSVSDNLGLLKAVNKQITDEQISQLLSELEIADVSDKLASQLSGGEAQRVAIARALLKETKVILADEPTGSLDMRNTERVMSIFQRLAKDGKSIVYVTHDLHLAAKADQIYVISDGKIVNCITNDYKSNIALTLEQIFIRMEGARDESF